MAVKISVKKELGTSKLIEVKESNKNIRSTWKLQKMMAKLSIEQETIDDSPESFEKMIDTMLDVQEKTIGYISDILRLDDDQVKKLEDMEFNETMDFAVRIGAELMHIEAEPTSEKEVGLEA